MRRLSCTATAFVFLSSGIVQAAPVLIGSFDFDVDTDVPVGSRFGFVLQMLDADNNFLEIGPPLGGVGHDVRLGPEVFWGNGESGVRLFTPNTHSAFDAFAELLTDGIDDSLIVFWQWEDDGGFGGNGKFESEFFGDPQGLAGHTLDAIQLTVREVSIGPHGVDYQHVSIRTTYDFFGTPVPEPATIILLGAGFPIIARCSGCRYRRRNT